MLKKELLIILGLGLLNQNNDSGFFNNNNMLLLLLALLFLIDTNTIEEDELRAFRRGRVLQSRIDNGCGHDSCCFNGCRGNQGIGYY